MRSAIQTLKEIATSRQHARLLYLEFPDSDGPDALLLANKFDAMESVSKDFTYIIEVLSDNATLSLKSLQGRSVTITLALGDGDVRYFNGHVFEFQLLKTDEGVAWYRMVLKPWMAYLKLRHDYYLFHNQDLMAQTEEVFKDYLHIAKWRSELSREMPVITQSCQHNESDFNFLSRHWEAAGWHYRFEHTETEHTLILSDDSTTPFSTYSIGGDGTVALQGDTHLDESNTIKNWSPARNIVPSTTILSGFNFKNPKPVKVGVRTMNKQGAVEPIEHYDYAGTYPFKNSAAADAHVRLRMEELETNVKIIEGQSNNGHLVTGKWLRLVDKYGHNIYKGGDAKNTFFIISIHHSASNNYLQEVNEPATYSNTFTCSRLNVPWRPGRGFNSVDTKMFALQTATVVTPNGENSYCDEFGRVRVQLHWDRQGKDKGGMTTWLRCMSNWAGAQMGLETIPRNGMEVVIACLDGNVDRMVIIGCIHNGHKLPSWELPGQSALSGMRSRELTPNGGNSAAGRSNHLILDDTSGKIQAQIKSDHLDSQLSLGHVCRIDGNTGRKDERGEGFGLETNGIGAVRASKGLLLSTDHRAKAAGRLDAREELLGQLDVAMSIMKQLAELAATHEAEDTDTAPVQKLVDQIKSWGTEASASAAAIAITAPAGVAVSSSNSVTTSAGTNLDMVAIQDANISTGRKVLIRAGQGIAAFARQCGMKLIAGSGKLTLQAQDGEMDIGASKDVHIYSLETLLMQAKKLALRIDGAEITMDNGEITISATKPIKVKGAGFVFESGGGAQTTLPTMPHSTLATDERSAFVDSGGNALENIDYAVHDTAGAVAGSGKSVVNGATQSAITDSVIKALSVHLKL
jgi:type VI secretion system secreted protein VgrG